MLYLNKLTFIGATISFVKSCLISWNTCEFNLEKVPEVDLEILVIHV